MTDYYVIVNEDGYTPTHGYLVGQIVSWDDLDTSPIIPQEPGVERKNEWAVEYTDGIILRAFIAYPTESDSWHVRLAKIDFDPRDYDGFNSIKDELE